MRQDYEFGEQTGTEEIGADIVQLRTAGYASHQHLPAEAFLALRELRLIRRALEGICGYVEGIDWGVNSIDDKLRENDD
jgi:hypothetical protein